jgi:1-acyl-sn-glycerol-3-phosphate acyltransferase
VRQIAGSAAFTLLFVVSVPVYGALALLCWPFGHRAVYRVARWWVDAQLFGLRTLCRLDYRVEGRENLPAATSVVLMKHSSTWETLAQLRIFPTQTWVLKRELLWVPVFGWVLRALHPIAIDRKAGSGAVQQVLEQGKAELEAGLWVVIFPEGTRMPAGTTRRYGISGALLASTAGRPIVPVAHDAGEFWPRRGWLKRPGTIRVVIGPPIEAAGRDARLVNEQAQTWIEREVARITGRPVATAEAVPASR